MLCFRHRKAIAIASAARRLIFILSSASPEKHPYRVGVYLFSKQVTTSRTISRSRLKWPLDERWNQPKSWYRLRLIGQLYLPGQSLRMHLLRIITTHPITKLHLPRSTPPKRNRLSTLRHLGRSISTANRLFLLTEERLRSISLTKYRYLRNLWTIRWWSSIWICRILNRSSNLFTKSTEQNIGSVTSMHIRERLHYKRDTNNPTSMWHKHIEIHEHSNLWLSENNKHLPQHILVRIHKNRELIRPIRWTT
jgi:hypothetical protein